MLDGVMVAGLSVSVGLILGHYWRSKAKITTAAPVTYINPPGLSKPVGYSHITTAILKENSRLVCIAGQASLDKDKENTVIAENDLQAQAENAYANLKIALAAVGAGPENVMKSNIYTTVNTEESLSIIVGARERFFKDCKSSPPGALLGVPFLALPGLLVEVDAEAVVTDSLKI